MLNLSGGQAIVQQIKMEGIEVLFALPGYQLDWIFDALYEEQGSMRLIPTRHEQAAAYMADGYARATGRVGACLVVPGPGLLNATGALCTAYATNSPVLCITSQIPSQLIDVGRGVPHEIKDQLGMIKSVTKWQERGMTPEELPSLVHRAFEALLTGRPRPVEFEVPMDILQQSGDVQLFEAEASDPPAGDLDLIDQAAKLLGEAASPLIMSGGGIIGGAAWEELQRLAETLEAPVVMTSNGYGALSARHHLAQTQRALPSLLPKADVVLVVGSRFVQGATDAWRDRGRTVIQMDIDPDELGRNYAPDIGIIADAKRGLAALGERVERYNRVRPSRQEELTILKQACAAEGNKWHPQSDFGNAIRAEMPDDAILFPEVTQVGQWANQFFPVFAPRTFFGTGYQATLGHGFPAALGAQVGRPDRKVVSLNGDGGFFYNVQELSTMVHQKIPAVAIVFNDNAYGNVKRMQQEQFGRGIGSELLNPDMLKLAEAYGVQGHRASTPEELRTALRTALASAEPALIEVPVGPMPRISQ
jgi:acetolactate synthase-1/2/3 large subunit